MQIHLEDNALHFRPTIQQAWPRAFTSSLRRTCWKFIISISQCQLQMSYLFLFGFFLHSSGLSRAQSMISRVQSMIFHELPSPISLLSFPQQKLSLFSFFVVFSFLSPPHFFLFLIILFFGEVLKNYFLFVILYLYIFNFFKVL